MKTVENPMAKNQAVMIVDDYPALLQIVIRMLRKAGYSKVFQATNGFDCLQLAQKNIIDVILLDISMPGINGMDTCKVLRSSATNNHAHIIACTAHAHEIHRQTFLEAGFNDILPKPFGYSELIDKLTASPDK